jgi:hypothetical protein
VGTDRAGVTNLRVRAQVPRRLQLQLQGTVPCKAVALRTGYGIVRTWRRRWRVKSLSTGRHLRAMRKLARSYAAGSGIRSRLMLPRISPSEFHSFSCIHDSISLRTVRR